MGIVRPIFFLLCLWSVGSAMATNLFLLNKTGQPLYYKLLHLTFGQTFLPFITPTDKALQDKVKEGLLVNNGVAHIKSYRLSTLSLKKEKDGASLVTSIAGDQRIRGMCQARKISDCFGSTLRSLKPSIWNGAIEINQDIKNIARPVVLVVTLDPAKEKLGTVGYIVTELAHTWGLVRRPKPFFYELQGEKTPAAVR